MGPGENMLLPMGENSTLPASGDITLGDMNSASNRGHQSAMFLDLH